MEDSIFIRLATKYIQDLEEAKSTDFKKNIIIKGNINLKAQQLLHDKFSESPLFKAYGETLDLGRLLITALEYIADLEDSNYTFVEQLPISGGN